jgi:hypothetical protein
MAYVTNPSGDLRVDHSRRGERDAEFETCLSLVQWVARLVEDRGRSAEPCDAVVGVSGRGEGVAELDQGLAPAGPITEL